MIPLFASKGRPPVSLFLFFLVLPLIPGCGRADEQQTVSRSGHIRDDFGFSIPTHPLPRRIVSLAPSITETLFALGLDSSVAGVTDYCDYPPAAGGRPSVGGLTSPSFERIVELDPDLILMSVAGNSLADHDRLVNLGFRVFVTDPSGLDDLYNTMENIGTLTGTRAAADSLVASLRQDQRRLTHRARERPTKSVFMLLSLRPLIAAGDGTFLHELLSLANTRNLAAGTTTSYPILSREHIVALQPDALLVTHDIAESRENMLARFPEWKNLEALRADQVIILDANLVSRPGPRVMQGLEQMVTALR